MGQPITGLGSDLARWLGNSDREVPYATPPQSHDWKRISDQPLPSSPGGSRQIFDMENRTLSHEKLPWDQARPGMDCLSIAIGRMLRAEIAKHQGIHTVTRLADLTCFYDHVDLDQIIEPARDLAYPPLRLMQVCA